MSKKINFVDHKGSPLASCHFEIVQNNRVLISGQTDAQGKAEITQKVFILRTRLGVYIRH